MKRFVIIPFDYEELDYREQNQVIPICVAKFDDLGQEIAQGWFNALNEGADVVRKTTRYLLRDVRRVSEVAEPAIHGLWRRHGSAFGRSPTAQVVSACQFSARQIQEQDKGLATRTRKVLALDSMAPAVRELMLRDPKDHEQWYENEMSIERLRKAFLARGMTDMVEALDLARSGYRWKEIGADLQLDPNYVQRIFRRWRDRFARLMQTSPDGRKNTSLNR